MALHRIRWSFILVALSIAILSLTGMDVQAAEDLRLAVEKSGSQTHLRLQGGVVFHSTSHEIRKARVVDMPNSAVRLVLWEEAGAAGGGKVVSYSAISLDGQNIAKVGKASTTIRLWHGDFDPLVDIQSVNPKLSANESGNLFIVQFETQPLEEFHRGIMDSGGTIHAYVADHAYVVRMDAKAKTQVEALPYVRWVGKYHPAYRMEPSLSDQLGQKGAAGGTASTYNIMVFEKGDRPGDQKPTVASRIASMGGLIQKADAGARLLEATLTPGQLLQVAGWDEVQFIDRWSEPEEDMDIAREISGGNYFHNTLGLTGAGVRAEVMDGGLLQTHTDYTPAPVIHGGTPFASSHGTATYGINFGDGNICQKGVLPNATGIFAGYNNMLVSRYNHTGELVNSALSYNAVYQSNSWGNARTFNYTTISAEMDQMIFDHDFLIFQSQSNAGTQDSRPQAWAKNIVSVGGVRHAGTLTTADDAWANGASVGPASDGRIKPDLAHFYDYIDTTTSSSNTACTATFGGTSGATPITAGHAGLFFELWHNGTLGNTPGASVFASRPHISLAKAMLICTSDQWTFSGWDHDLTRMHQGWGRVSVQNIYDNRNKIFWVDESDILTVLDSKSYSISVASGEPSLKATLTWTDPPGNPTVQAQHRINDLNLKVTSPTGDIYWGNNGLHSNMWSITGGAANDKDTVENVFVENPTAGTWTVEVIAAEINQDGHVETGALDADYALVVLAGAQAVGTTSVIPTASHWSLMAMALLFFSLASWFLFRRIMVKD